jgi:hypothetical protein
MLAATWLNYAYYYVVGLSTHTPGLSEAAAGLVHLLNVLWLLNTKQDVRV